MEQIFMIEVLVKKIEIKVVPREKDEYELRMEEEERKREEEALAAKLLAESLKKKKGKPKKEKKPKKGKGKKGPAGPTEEELKYMKSCSMQLNCLPIFDFYIAHDNFIAPPPPPPPGKKGKKAKPKPKKKKKKKGPRKIILPSEPLPQPPYFGVGNSVVFISRPDKLTDTLKGSPLKLSVWARDEALACVAQGEIEWHPTFFDCINRANEFNPMDLDIAQYRNTNNPILFVNTLELSRNISSADNCIANVEFCVRLSCLGNKIISYFIALPEMERIPGRRYIQDDLNLKDVEVVRNWEGTVIEALPPVAYLYGAPELLMAPPEPPPAPVVFDDYKAPFTNSELCILAMGFPKGPCGGTNCPKRLEYRGSEYQFIPGEKYKTPQGIKYKPGTFVNKRDVHGPCGRLDCPLAKKIRHYLCNEGSYKPCKKPCPKEYY